MASQTVVLDTNIVLDLFVFADEAARPLRSRLEDADYEGHSLAMLNRIAVALKRRVEIRFVARSKSRLQPV